MNRVHVLFRFVLVIIVAALPVCMHVFVCGFVLYVRDMVLARTLSLVRPFCVGVHVCVFIPRVLQGKCAEKIWEN